MYLDSYLSHISFYYTQFFPSWFYALLSFFISLLCWHPIFLATPQTPIAPGPLLLSSLQPFRGKDFPGITRVPIVHHWVFSMGVLVCVSACYSGVYASFQCVCHFSACVCVLCLQWWVTNLKAGSTSPLHQRGQKPGQGHTHAITQIHAYVQKDMLDIYLNHTRLDETQHLLLSYIWETDKHQYKQNPHLHPVCQHCNEMLLR